MKRLILFLGCMLPFIGWSQNASEWYDKAVKTKDYTKKAAYYSEVINLNPRHALAYYGRGTAYNQLRRYDDAIKDFTSSLKYKPNYERAYNGRGYAYMQLKEYKKAVSDFDKAVRIKPSYSIAHHYKGNANTKQGEHDDAIKDYTNAIKHRKNYFHAYNSRGYSKQAKGCFSESIKDFDKAIEINPQFYQAYNNRGFSYMRLKKYKNALADFEKSLTIQPNYQEASQNMASLGALSKDFQNKTYIYLSWWEKYHDWVINTTDSVFVLKASYTSSHHVEISDFIVYVSSMEDMTIIEKHLETKCEPNQGYFVATIRLKPGRNEIRMEVNNEAGNDKTIADLIVNRKD